MHYLEDQYWQDKQIQQQAESDQRIKAASIATDLAIVSALRAKIVPDGNAWCVLYGENLQEGLCGFGDTPEKAVMDFNNNYYKQTLKSAKP